MDFQRTFESLPGLYVILKPDLTIVAVSEAYLRTTKTRREDLLGRRLFEVWADDPDDPKTSAVRDLRTSLDRVVKCRAPDVMRIQRYDFRRPRAEGGGLEERYWRLTNAPLLGADGELASLIHQVEDVTDVIRLKQHGEAQGEIAAGLRARTTALEAEVLAIAQELRAAHAKLAALADGTRA